MSEDKYQKIWNDVWEKVKTYNNIDTNQVNAFFSRLVPQAFSEGFLMLTADTGFIKTWIENKYLTVIKQALEDIYGVPFEVAIEVDTNTYINPAPQQVEQISKTPQIDNNIISNTTPQEEKHQVENKESSLVSEYTFDNFVVGSSNKLAHSMAITVAENPGEGPLNPLFIYGKSGLGKTHLLRAIQNYINHNYPHMKTVYVDTMELVNDYTDAAIYSKQGNGKEYSTFKQRYLDADVVLIDDVQGLQGKKETLNIVFQIFNYLTDYGKQIVLSADRAPKHIDIDERYQSRFNEGGVCDIQPPEVETKLGIIRNFIEECKRKGELDFEISPEIQDYIAHNSSSNIRELKSAITKIIFYGHNMEKEDISFDNISLILKDHFSGGAMKRLTVEDIQKVTENYYSISHTDLVGKKRSADIVHARMVAIWLCRTMIDIPYKAIGQKFNRDHATIMHSVNTIETKLKESREINEEIEIIKKMILEQ